MLSPLLDLNPFSLSGNDIAEAFNMRAISLGTEIVRLEETGVPDDALLARFLGALVTEYEELAKLFKTEAPPSCGPYGCS